MDCCRSPSTSCSSIRNTSTERVKREPGQPRTFVQQLIERERDHVWDLIASGAVIYVCGNANTMAPGVRAALMEIYRAKTNGSGPSADEWLQGLRDTDRYLEDIWGEMASAL